MANTFPLDLMQQYKSTCNKLRKIQRVVFKRFAPNIFDVSNDFNQLALSFDKSYLPEYAALCYMGVAKCEKIIGNPLAEVDAHLKAARSFTKADDKIKKLNIENDNHENLEGALRCYNQALSILPDDSVMKAAIIRELKIIDPNAENTSNFSSPSHRIWDLELSAKESIKCHDYVAAFEKLTEIYDDITERKCQEFYEDVMKRNEISRLLLLCLLQLPPSVRYDHKFIEKYSCIDDSSAETKTNLPEDIFFLLQSLVISCQTKNLECLFDVRDQLSQYSILTTDHQFLLKELVGKYQK